jgi:Zn-dependent M28 family amino/carboxypeptidase
VVLLAAALARGPQPARSVVFACFSAEEKGLLGSAAFAEQPPVPLAQVVANVNIEMIGRPLPGRQRCAWITGREYSDFAAIAGPALLRAGIELIDFEMAGQLFAQSDNLSFARKGVVAHSISAGSLHADYHQPSDEVELLDLPHMTAVIHGLEAVVRELADRAGRPAWSEQGRQVLERLRR